MRPRIQTDELAVLGFVGGAFLYALSFFLPALGPAGEPQVMSGAEAFTFLLFIPSAMEGFDPGFYRVLFYVLLPNPLLVIGMLGLLFGRRHLPWITSSLALFIGLSSWCLLEPGYGE